MNTILKNGFFLLNDGSDKLFHGSMRINGTRIEKFSHSVKSTGDQVIDLKGALVIPGFVQTHVHLCQTLFRNLADDLELMDWLKNRIWPMEGAHNESSLESSAHLGIAELLSSGTTTILDMATVRHTDVIFSVAQEMGIRAVIGKCLMDHPSSPRELRQNTQLTLQENLALFHRWHKKDSRLEYALTPRFLLSCTDRLLGEIRELAQAENLLVHSHSSENHGEIAAIRQRFGMENIEAFHRLGLTSPNLVLAHCVWLSKKEIRILRDTNSKVTHCASANLKLASGIAPILELLKQGVTIGLGADGAPCNNQLNAFQEMRLASLIQKPLHGPQAMRARAVFELATLGGAKVLGKEKEIGSLEVGKKADFAVLDVSGLALDLKADINQVYSALVYAGTSCQVKQTWVDGVPVFQNGLFKGKDPLAWTRSAIKQRRKLLTRAF